MSKIKSVIGNLTMQMIPENALLHEVVKELQGREVFIDNDLSVNERIYYGSVFESIACEYEQLAESDVMIKLSNKAIEQVNELAKLITADYVLITLA